MDRGTLLLVALALLAAASVALGISGVRIFRSSPPGEAARSNDTGANEGDQS